MPTFQAISSLADESILIGILAGIFLVAAVQIALRSFSSLNAATRITIWSATMLFLPLLLPLYFFSHIPASEPQPAPVVQSPAPVAHPVATASPVVQASIQSIDPPKQTAHSIQIPLPENFFAALLAAYCAIVPLFLLRLFVSYIRLLILRRSTQAAPAELSARLQLWLQRCPTLRPVQLRISQRARSPLAIGFVRPMIVMPADLALELSQQEYDDLGVHELAHISRYDDWTNLSQRLLQAFFFFHPAVHYVARKLNLERELACDDWVVVAHESKSYARCLAKVVELRHYRRGALLLSSGAFFGKRQIVTRVESLLNRTRNAGTAVSAVAVILGVLALVGMATQIVNLPAVVAFTQEEGGATTSSRWSDDSRDLRIKIRGDLTFSDDEQSIASITPDGFFIVDENKHFSSHRRIEVRPSQNGTPQTKYFLDGREKPLDGVGRVWASGVYLFALRELGLDSEGRVSRILKRKGVPGVLDEVNLIGSDHVKCEYLNHLLEQAQLTPADRQRVTDSVRKVSSDNDKADFLVAHAQDLATRESRNGYFSAVNSINSDNDRRRVLMHMLEIDGHDADTARLIGQSAKTMNSDNDKADVLLAIPSAATGDARCSLLNAARTIQSDNDKARVLRDTGYAESAECRGAWFAVVNEIQSDNDRSNALQSVLKLSNLQADTYRDVAKSAKGMNSDNDKANVLVLLSAHYSETPFFDAVASINSDNDRGRVLKALLETNPSKAQVLQIIDSAIGLNDDNEKTEILLAIAKRNKEPEVRASLQKACGKLTSDNDYRRVASALFEN